MATTTDDMIRGIGWTPARFRRLRELAGQHVLPRYEFRKDLCEAIGVTERSWFRWEHGQTSCDYARRLMIGQWCAENLPREAFEELAASPEAVEALV